MRENNSRGFMDIFSLNINKITNMVKAPGWLGNFLTLIEFSQEPAIP